MSKIKMSQFRTLADYNAATAQDAPKRKAPRWLAKILRRG